FDMMRQQVRKAGLPGIYFIACDQKEGRDVNQSATQRALKAEGYDAASAYAYPDVSSRFRWGPYSGLVKGHVQAWNRSLQNKDLQYIPVWTAGRDDRPWLGDAGIRVDIRYGRSTAYLKDGLTAMKKYMDAHDMHIGMIEAWNEWGEGAYIEPSAEFGFGDLEAVRSIFAPSSKYPQNIAPGDVGLGPYNLVTIDHELLIK
ncbi:MAG TPA: glycoside hydrolase family 99-like domain-containing protein, partial [Methylococcales bacterium]